MDFELARANMVIQQIKPWQVTTHAVLDAFSAVPREKFVPAAYTAVAYSDTNIPLTPTATLLPGKIIAKALESLALTGNEKVLEIGTGSGYATACLSLLAHTVISVEPNPALLQLARNHLFDLQRTNVIFESGDAALGWEHHAPFDAIVVLAAYPLGVPQSVCEQLKIGGRLFAVRGNAPAMQALCIERLTSTDFRTTVLFETCVPVLAGAPRPSSFAF